MKLSYLNKSFVIIILLLLISSYYTHPIQVRAHTEKNEIYIQFLGIPSLDSKKIIPTEQQITTLTQTISNIRKKMEYTQTYEDALIIFTDALEIFHKSAILTDIQHDKTIRTLTLLKPIFEHRNIDNTPQTTDQNTTNYL